MSKPFMTNLNFINLGKNCGKDNLVSDYNSDSDLKLTILLKFKILKISNNQ